MGWLATGFSPPLHAGLAGGEHLRPIRATDAEIDLPAVLGSRESLWERYGAAWGWPTAGLTLEQDRDDLARHEQEADSLEAFNYAVLSGDESQLLGCLYIDPPDREGFDATISWWLVDELADGETARELERFVPRWIAESWPFQRPRWGVFGEPR